MLTYAMLDSCSQGGSFIQEDPIKELQLSGRKTIVNLKTLNGERIESTVLIEGMDGKGFSGNNSCIKLPKIILGQSCLMTKKILLPLIKSNNGII